MQNIKKVGRVAQSTYLALIALLLPELSLGAHADGPINLGRRAFGVNRRVTSTQNNFVGIRGEFTVPIIFVPEPNTARSKPTFYLGSLTDDVVIDAGVQWESERAGVRAGWTLFISNSGVPEAYQYTMPQGLDNGTPRARVPWRSDPNGATPANPNVTSFVLEHLVYPGGGVSLKATAVGADYGPASVDAGYATEGLFYWGNSSNGYDNGRTAGRVYPLFPVGSARAGQTDLTNLRMKRVIGITQGGAPNSPPAGSTNGISELDNSFMIGCHFSGGKLATRTATPSGGFTDSWGTNFTLANVDDASTGYAPDGRDNGRPNRWIVDFNFTGMRSPGATGTGDPAGSDSAGTYRNDRVAARYEAETVHVFLRRSAPVTGDIVVPGLNFPR